MTWYVPLIFAPEDPLSMQINNFSRKPRTMMRILTGLICLALVAGCGQQRKEQATLVVQTDFGVKDGAVAAMKGVANEVDRNLEVVDLTHEIPAYNTWEAAYRLGQVVPYWPEGTVFVSVVDPGVGTERKSVVVKTKQGHYIVTPDNGTTTLIAELEGVSESRTIDESVNRRRGSDSSYTFHGRDVYMYTAARLASGKISFEEVGPVLKEPLKAIPFQQAVFEDKQLKGTIPVLDSQYGNVWTNIPGSLVQKAGISIGDTLAVTIQFNDSVVYSGKLPFVNTFGDVSAGKALGYLNSLLNFSLAINQGSFSKTFQVQSGPGWTIAIKK